MRIYLAGPLFTMAEREWNVRLKEALEEYDIDVWLPQENEPRERTAREIFLKDVEGIDWAEGVIAIMDGPDPDSGTSWECGYAYAKGKPIILLRTDFRTNPDGFAPYNLMLTESANEATFLPGKAVYEIAFALNEYVKRVKP
jgi:nucleoside 2-deoxyribosyltransferase